jgi:hypothetical protein
MTQTWVSVLRSTYESVLSPPMPTQLILWSGCVAKTVISRYFPAG